MKFSQYPLAESLSSNNDSIPILAGGTNKRTTIAKIAEKIKENLAINDPAYVISLDAAKAAVDQAILDVAQAIIDAGDATTAANVAAATYNLIQFMPGQRFIGDIEAIFALTDETGRVCMFFDVDGVGHFPAGITGIQNQFDTVDMDGITLDAVWGIRDQVGRIALYIDSLGVIHARKIVSDIVETEELLGNNQTIENGFETIDTTDVTTDAVWGIKDQAGRLPIYIGSAGDFYARNINVKKNLNLETLGGIRLVSTPDLVCLGDSLTAGTNAGTTPYQTFLKLLYPTRAITNDGIGGHTPEEIAARFGAELVMVTVAGNEIPASGDVSVTIYSGADLLRASTTFTVSCTIAGVNGTLSKPSGYVFTRTTAGDAVITGVEELIINNDSRRIRTAIIWSGRNGITSLSDRNHVVPRTVKNIVAHLKAIEKRFVVMSILNQENEPSGSANYDKIIEANKALELSFPYNYLDIRGILATEPDDTVPAALRYDSLHLNAAGNEIVANEIYKFMQRKGF